MWVIFIAKIIQKVDLKMKEKDIKISLVVACDGADEHLDACLKCLLNQTIKKIEIICVVSEDDKAIETVRSFSKTNMRIKPLVQKASSSLQAYLFGAAVARGEYITFLHGFNKVSIDFYRNLRLAAQKNNADVVLGDIAELLDTSERFYYNLDPIRLQNYCLQGEDIFREYLNNKGLFFGYTFFENLLIEKKFWKEKIQPRIQEELSKGKGYLGSEHIVCSALVWKFAEKLVNVHGVWFFRRKHDPVVSIERAIVNRTLALDFVRALVESDDAKGMSDLDKWRQLEGKMLAHEARVLEKRYSCLPEISKNYGISQYADISQTDKYYYSAQTKFGHMFDAEERLLESICWAKTKYISFDVFDTLIQRPFMEPSDMFCLMHEYFAEITGAESLINFKQIRLEAEQLAVKRMKQEHPDWEGVTLDEIYREMEITYGFSQEITEKLKQKEQDLELRFCTARRTAKRIFDFVKECGKKIVIISDMYLSAEWIGKILEKNGYSDYKLYVSCEYRLSKASGNLFRKVLDDLGMKDNPELVHHIGDDYRNDFVIPRSIGLKASHFEKASKLIKNANLGIYSGETYKNIFVRKNIYFNESREVNSFFGTQSFMAVVANKLFDSPYISYNENSDFNADPYVIGYYCLGLELLALTKWLLDETRGRVGTIHFVARDGWMPKCFYDEYSKYIENAPRSNYLYVSRKALLTADMRSCIDLYALSDKISINAFSPCSTLRVLKTVIRDEDFENVCRFFEQSETYETKFDSKESFYNFIRCLIENFESCFDFETYRAKLKSSFSKIIQEGDVLFDVGYSGRAELALSSILGYPVNSYYIHSKNDTLSERAKHGGFHNKCFYDWRPNLTGVVREHMLMRLAPSTVGYDFTSDGELIPVFDKFDENEQTCLMTEIMQNAAMDFCKDMLAYFSDILDNLFSRPFDLALPFEYYINAAKAEDKKVFGCLNFEDDLGMGYSVNAIDFWNDRMNKFLPNLYAPKKNDLLRTSAPVDPYGFTDARKILLYSNEFSWSGAPRSLLRIAKILKLRGWDIEMWGGRNKYDGFEEEIHNFGIYTKIISAADIEIRELKKFELCIVNTIEPSDVYAKVSKVIPTIWYIREATNIPIFFKMKADMEMTLREAERVYCVSGYAAEYIRQFNKNVKVVHNCVEDLFDGEFKKPEKIIRFLSLGTVEPRKGYDVVLDALQMLPKKYRKSIKFAFAGRFIRLVSAPTFGQDILNKVEQDECVEYLGVLNTEDEIRAAYKAADVVIVPSRDESCSLVALEGAMYGKPLIVTENVGAKYMVSHENGFIVQTGSAVSLAKAFKSIVNRRSELEKMGRASRRAYEEKASMASYERDIMRMIRENLPRNSCGTTVGAISVQEQLSALSAIETEKFRAVVPVVYSSSDSFVPYTMVSIESLVANGSSDIYYDIYILSTKILPEQKERIEKFCGQNYRVNVIYIDELLQRDGFHFKMSTHVSVETYYRYYAPEILNYDKILFVDSDTVVLGDVAELYKTDLGEKPLGAVRNFMNGFVFNYVSKKLELDPKTYFNCGILLFNSKVFEREQIRRKAFSLVDNRDDYLIVDQDALNIICKGNAVVLPSSWNVQWHHYNNGLNLVEGKEEYLKAYAHPDILHFTDRFKPWNSVSMEKSDLFWNYAAKSEYFLDILHANSGALGTEFTLKEREKELAQYKKKVISLEEDTIIRLRQEIAATCSSKSYKLGRMLTWPFRMAGKFFASLKNSGLRVTMRKVKRKIYFAKNKLSN